MLRPSALRAVLDGAAPEPRPRAAAASAASAAIVTLLASGRADAVCVGPPGRRRGVLQVRRYAGADSARHGVPGPEAPGSAPLPRVRPAALYDEPRFVLRSIVPSRNPSLAGLDVFGRAGRGILPGLPQPDAAPPVPAAHRAADATAPLRRARFAGGQMASARSASLPPDAAPHPCLGPVPAASPLACAGLGRSWQAWRGSLRAAEYGQLAHSAYVLRCARPRMDIMEALADGAPTALAAGAALVAMAAVLSWLP